MSDEKCRDDFVKTSFGSTISIHYNKDGSMTQAVIGQTAKPHHYFALLDKSDVPFAIKIDNNACKDRKMGTVLELLKRRRGFVVDRGESEQLETFESFGGKFHIVSQHSRNGEELISLATKGSDDITYSEASIEASQIKFTVKYSRSFNATFKIIVKYLGKAYEVKVMKSNTLGELKDKIEAQLGFKPFALSFKSVVLMGDTNSLDRYGIDENDEIYIPTEITAMNFENETTIGKNPKKHFQIWFSQQSSITIEHLKFMIDVEEGIPAEELMLEFANKSLPNLGTYKFEKDGVITIRKRVYGGGEVVFRRCDKCNWKHYSNRKCISEDEYHRESHEKGIVCVNPKEKSEQEFISTTFIEDESVEVISFTIEMRLKGPYDLIL